MNVTRVQVQACDLVGGEVSGRDAVVAYVPYTGVAGKDCG